MNVVNFRDTGNTSCEFNFLKFYLISMLIKNADFFTVRDDCFPPPHFPIPVTQI